MCFPFSWYGLLKPIFCVIVTRLREYRKDNKHKHWERERWLRDCWYMLLLQRAQVQFPESQRAAQYTVILARWSNVLLGPPWALNSYVEPTTASHIHNLKYSNKQLHKDFQDKHQLACPQTRDLFFFLLVSGVMFKSKLSNNIEEWIISLKRRSSTNTKSC